jgi:hypothetical protein
MARYTQRNGDIGVRTVRLSVGQLWHAPDRPIALLSATIAANGRSFGELE